MLKVLSLLVWIALAMGIGEIGFHALMAMAGKAAYAQRHDQMSFSKWNRMLWESKANSPLVRPEKN
jgi:hypothetical protein